MTFALPEAGASGDPAAALARFWSIGTAREDAASGLPPGMPDIFIQAQRLQLILFGDVLKLWLLPFTAFEDAPTPRTAVVAETEKSPASQPTATTQAEDTPDAPAPTQSIVVASEPEAASSTTASPDAAPLAAPALLDKPDGEPDDLQRIVGIGAKLSQTLNRLGIWHFRQIAALSPAEAAWLDDKIGFKGRVEREGWRAQASRLAKAARPAKAA